MVSQLTVIDTAFRSRSPGGWVGGDKKDAWREIKERKPEREIKQVQKQMLAGYFSDPLSAKETQQQIAALHCQIYP